MTTELATRIDAAWEDRATVTPASHEVGEAVAAALDMLDTGKARVAEPDGNGDWRVNQWLKKAVLLSFRLNENRVMDGGSASIAPSDGSTSTVTLSTGCEVKRIE